MEFWQRCDHEWEDVDDEVGVYRLSTCMICGAYRHQDFVNSTDFITAPDEGNPEDAVPPTEEEIERDRRFQEEYGDGCG